MTSVVIAPRLEDPLSDTEAIVTGWWFRIRPSKTYVAGGQWVLAEWPPALTPITGSSVTALLDPLPDVPYEFELYRSDDLRNPVLREFRIVPSSGSPVNWWDLDQVSGPDADPVLTNEVDARLTALEAALGSVSGGASNLASITDMSAFMRTVNDDTSASAARATLGAGTASTKSDVGLGSVDNTSDLAKPISTATQTALDAKANSNNAVFTGTVTVPDGALAIADVSGLQAALDGAGASSYIPVDWDGVGPFVRPSSDTTKRYEVVGPLPAPPIASPANTGTAGMYDNDRFTLLS